MAVQAESYETRNEAFAGAGDLAEGDESREETLRD
jgi:hypothetical protein